MVLGTLRARLAPLRRHVESALSLCGLGTVRRQCTFFVLVAVLVFVLRFVSHMQDVPVTTSGAPIPGAAERLRRCLSKSVFSWKDTAGDLSNFADHFHVEGEGEVPLPYFGNGFLGATLGAPFFQVAGVYARLGVNSRLARVPNILGTTVTVATADREASAVATALDVRRGMVHRATCFVDETEGEVSVEETWYAHRVIDGLMAHTVRITNNRQRSASVEIRVPNMRSDDFIATVVTREAVAAGATDASAAGGEAVEVFDGTVAEGELPNVAVASIAVAWNVLPQVMTVAGRRSETQRRLVAVAADIPRPPTDGEVVAKGVAAPPPAGSVSPDKLADQAVALCRKHLRRHLDGTLAREHEAGWAAIWERGGVRFDEHVTAAGVPLDRLANTTAYYLHSSLSPSRANSVSPGGLAGGRQCYNEHVFWDAETWILPAVQPFHPQLAERMIDYRFERLGLAETKAKVMGFKGAMFPWQSAATGAEACPEKAHAEGEIHIVGDIALAVRQQYQLTLDDVWLAQKGWPIVRGAAKFFASRVTEVPVPGGVSVYAINNVVPPDEYAVGVDNSVYTNAIAKITLEFAARARAIVGAAEEAAEAAEWLSIASRIVIPYDAASTLHPEYTGYKGHTVKQADAILLGYPLSHPMPQHVRAKDLEFYRERTDKNGPAMSSAMFAIGYLGLRDKSEKWEADYHLSRSYEVVDGRFDVWHEMTGSRGCQHFLTGAGGFLQALIYGYAGLRVFANHLRISPTPPSSSHGISLVGIRYASLVFDVSSTDTKVVVLLRAEERRKDNPRPGPPRLYVCDGGCRDGITALGIGESRAFSRGVIHLSINESSLVNLRLPDVVFDDDPTPEDPQLPSTARAASTAPDSGTGTIGALFRDHTVAMVLIILLVVVFHAVLFAMIYAEYCAGGAADGRRKRKISDMERARYE